MEKPKITEINEFMDHFSAVCRPLVKEYKGCVIDHATAKEIGACVLRRMLDTKIADPAWVTVTIPSIGPAGFEVTAGPGDFEGYPRFMMRIRSDGLSSPIRVSLAPECDTSERPGVVPIPDAATKAARGALASLSAETNTARIDPKPRIRLIDRITGPLTRLSASLSALKLKAMPGLPQADERYDPLKGKIRVDAFVFRPRENISAWELASIIEKARPFACEAVPGQPFAILGNVHRTLAPEVQRHFARTSRMVDEMG